jgi:hypothetical protein
MLFPILRKIILELLICVTFLQVSGQYAKGEFFGHMVLAANFCQIDGDQASGYNKFGFTLGYMVGQGLGKASHGGWAYTTGAGFSVRGSRRPFDPENPGLQSFHFVYQMIDIPIFINRYYKQLSFGLGMRTTYLLKAEDRDNFVLHLNDDMRKVGILGCFNVDYQFSDEWRAFAEAQYSLNSIRKANNTTNVFYPTGVYHNVISIGTKWQVSGSN